LSRITIPDPDEKGRIRVRVLHCLWHARIGGAERAVYQLIAAQARTDDLEPGLLVAQPGGEYFERVRDLGVPVIPVGLAGGADPRAPVLASRAMRGWDVHHFHSAEPALFSASLLVRGAVRVYTNRGGRPQETPSAAARVRHRAAGWMLRRGFHGFSGNTAHAARVAAGRYGLDPRVVAVTRNGLDFSLLEPLGDREAVRRDLGTSGSGFLVGTSGVLKAWKRIELLLEAVAATRETSVRAVIIGDGPARAGLESRAVELGIRDRVTFTGLLERVAEPVAALDAFVLTSGRQESFGNAVVEAMALGVPSIVFADSPGALEHVDPGRTGLVARDAGEVAAAIDRLAADPALGRAIGEAAARDVRTRYSLDAMVSAYRSLYLGARSRRDA
jgi:glycosyltransferase involved in cell wall biosynthesis